LWIAAILWNILVWMKVIGVKRAIKRDIGSCKMVHHWCKSTHNFFCNPNNLIISISRSNNGSQLQGFTLKLPFVKLTASIHLEIMSKLLFFISVFNSGTIYSSLPLCSYFSCATNFIYWSLAVLVTCYMGAEQPKRSVSFVFY